MHKDDKLNTALQAGYQDILNTIPDAVVSINEDQNIIFFNNSAEKMFGYTSQEILGKELETLIPSHFHHAHRARVANFVEGAHPPRFKQARGGVFGITKDGKTFAAEASISTIIVEGQKVTTAVVRDVTERKEAEKKLLIQSVAIENAGEAILVTNRDGIIEYVNKAFTLMTGYSSEEAIGQKPSLLKSTAQPPELYKELWDTITSGKMWYGTMVDMRKDGTFYPTQLSISPIFSNEGHITHYVSVQNDMSEKELLEKKLQQAQKMEALGTLVGGLAHDFNNILTGILGNAYLTKMEHETASNICKRMDTIESLGFSGANMIRQLLTFSRKEEVDMAHIEATAFLKETLKLSEVSIPERVRLRRNICTDELYVLANVTQLQQIIMNLVNNAYHAVKDMDSPEIQVTIESEVCSTQHLELAGKRCAKIAVKDNGYGIEPSHLHKIFEPFFTTKSAGTGTGLGLSMVYGAVNLHGGFIEAESEGLGKGATINIYIPLTKDNVFEEKKAGSQVEGLDGDGRCILLVDDDDGVLRSSKGLLESLNFTVLTASNGKQAIECLKSHVEQVELLITDLVMPTMGGLEAAKEMRELKSNLPIIFITGYEESFAMGKGKLPENSLLLTKPFMVKALEAGIHDLLDH